MYFWCICGEEGDLRILLFCHLEAPPLTPVFLMIMVDHLYMTNVNDPNKTSKILFPFLFFLVRKSINFLQKPYWINHRDSCMNCISPQRANTALCTRSSVFFFEALSFKGAILYVCLCVWRTREAYLRTVRKSGEHYMCFLLCSNVVWIIN